MIELPAKCCVHRGILFIHCGGQIKVGLTRICKERKVLHSHSMP